MVVGSIDTKDISVVVQGAIGEDTRKCTWSIRKRMPGTKIIISTWEGEKVDDLQYDIVIFNADPGSFEMSRFEKNNVKRQILSSIQGLRQVDTIYAMKIRSDIEIKNTNFLRYFELFNSYDENWHFLSGRIIVPSTVTRDPRVFESPMCPSDWCSFGYTEDMIKLWDVDFPSNEEINWFTYHSKTRNVNYYYSSLISRYNPEQYIWIGFVKKYKESLHSDNMFDINEDSVYETLKTFANNLIVLSMKQYGLNALKPPRKQSDRWHVLTYRDFIMIYNLCANGHKLLPLIDFQRIYNSKGIPVSYKRLIKLAKNKNDGFRFLKNEAKMFFPMAYYLFESMRINKRGT